MYEIYILLFLGLLLILGIIIYTVYLGTIPNEQQLLSDRDNTLTFAEKIGDDLLELIPELSLVDIEDITELKWNKWDLLDINTYKHLSDTKESNNGTLKIALIIDFDNVKYTVSTTLNINCFTSMATISNISISPSIQGLDINSLINQSFYVYFPTILCSNNGNIYIPLPSYIDSIYPVEPSEFDFDNGIVQSERLSLPIPVTTGPSLGGVNPAISRKQLYESVVANIQYKLNEIIKKASDNDQPIPNYSPPSTINKLNFSNISGSGTGTNKIGLVLCAPLKGQCIVCEHIPFIPCPVCHLYDTCVEKLTVSYSYSVDYLAGLGSLRIKLPTNITPVDSGSNLLLSFEVVMTADTFIGLYLSIASTTVRSASNPLKLSQAVVNAKFTVTLGCEFFTRNIIGFRLDGYTVNRITAENVIPASFATKFALDILQDKIEDAINKAFNEKIGLILNVIVLAALPININVYLPCGRQPCFTGHALPFPGPMTTGNITGTSLDVCTTACQSTQTAGVPETQRCEYAHFRFTDGTLQGNNGIGYCQLNRAGLGLGKGDIFDRLYHDFKVRMAETVTNPRPIQVLTLEDASETACKSWCHASSDCTGFTFERTTDIAGLVLGKCTFSTAELTDTSLLLNAPQTTCAWINPT